MVVAFVVVWKPALTCVYIGTGADAVPRCVYACFFFSLTGVDRAQLQEEERAKEAEAKKREEKKKKKVR